MNGTLLLTIQSVAQAGDDVLVLPVLSVEEYSLGAIDRVRIVTPERLVFEKEAEFAIPFDTASSVYILLIPNTQKEEIPIGSQIWIP